MNNYDRIIEGGIEALVEYAAETPSKHCAENRDYCDGCGWEGTCIGAFRAWLESEYVEPDSAEKISRELAMMAEADFYGGGWACAYGHSFKGYDHYDRCATCKFDRDKDCVEQVFQELSKRIAALDA